MTGNTLSLLTLTPSNSPLELDNVAELQRFQLSSTLSRLQWVGQL